VRVVQTCLQCSNQRSFVVSPPGVKTRKSKKKKKLRSKRPKREKCALVDPATE
jgi:hypothetical protein